VELQQVASCNNTLTTASHTIDLPFMLLPALQCHVNYSRLTPQDMLRLLGLLAGSQTRPNNIWWQGFLSTLQVRRCQCPTHLTRIHTRHVQATAACALADAAVIVERGPLVIFECFDVVS
jgi:hypothetical protein